MQDEQKSEYGLLIAKKSEKLVTALYLVTDLITDSEPMKSSLRRLAITLLSSMNTLAQPEVKDRITEYKMSLRQVTEILSLLHVARTTGIASEMNSTLLIDGFRSLQMVLEKKQPILTEEMLTIENENLLQRGESFSSGIKSSSYDALTPLAISRMQIDERKISSHDRSQDRSQDKTESYSKDTFNESKGQSSYVKDNTVFEAPRKPKSLHNVSSFQQRKISRRDQILALFVKGVDVSIRDIAFRIKGCSEKTIQRELNTLVQDNLVTRIGEKRWSRYVLR